MLLATLGDQRVMHVTTIKDKSFTGTTEAKRPTFGDVTEKNVPRSVTFIRQIYIHVTGSIIVNRLNWPTPRKILKTQVNFVNIEIYIFIPVYIDLSFDKFQ